MNTCKSCDDPTANLDVCNTCYRDPVTNDCENCGKHLSGINYPYVCGACISTQSQQDLDT